MIQKLKSIKQLCGRTLRNILKPSEAKNRGNFPFFGFGWEGGKNIWGPTFDREIPTYYRGLLG